MGKGEHPNGEQSPDREVGRREADQRMWTQRFIIQTAVTVIISLGAAFGGALLGAQTKTAVLESNFSELKGMFSTQNAKIDALSNLVTTTNVQNAGALGQLRSDIDARGRELEGIKRDHDREMSDLQRQNDKAIGELTENDKWFMSQLQGIRDKISRMEGASDAKK